MSSLLPNGEFFPFWEDETDYKKTLYVNCGNPAADDENTGTMEKPFKTINAAAKIAEPGTKIIISGGEYRETVKPARGGNDNRSMICYEAAKGESVVIKASVEAKKFKPSVGWNLVDRREFKEAPKGLKIWEIELDPEEFKGYNPFGMTNILHDYWFLRFDIADMTPYLKRRGAVFSDSKPLKQVNQYRLMAEETDTYWVEANGQKVHFRLSNDDDPKNHLIELTCREQCFAPDLPSLNFIRLKGLTCAHAATGSPVPQRGSISTNRGTHWIIEDCTINWSNALGMSLTQECWNREPVDRSQLGYHIVRGNFVRDCGVCGIAAMGSTHLLVEDNHIDGTGWQRMELSWEAGGIKTHNADRALFRRNIISRSLGCSAIWLDVEHLNCRITGNLFTDCIDARECVFMEANVTEENLIDNNIIWNVEGRFDRSAIKKPSGSAPWYRETEEQYESFKKDVENGWGIYSLGSDRLRIVNNLIGKCYNAGFYNKTASFRMIAQRGSTDRLHKFFNNIFYDCGEAAIKLPNRHNEADGNSYAKMPRQGGYLRIMRPAPSVILNLQAWQEFYKLDLNGSLSDITIDIDTINFKMIIEVIIEAPKVASDPKVKSDYFLDSIEGESRPAGPLNNLKPGKHVINIDPRRYKKN